VSAQIPKERGDLIEYPMLRANMADTNGRGLVLAATLLDAIIAGGGPCPRHATALAFVANPWTLDA